MPLMLAGDEAEQCCGSVTLVIVGVRDGFTGGKR